MALGRISGPLLKENLLRQEKDIAFETNLLYFDVNTHAADVAAFPLDPGLWSGRIGIRTDTPLYDVDVNGTLRSTNIIATEVDIGDLNIFENTISTVLGDITVRSSTTGKIILDSVTEVSENLIALADIQADGGSISTTAAEFYLLNNSNIPIYFGGESPDLYIGSINGLTTVNDNLQVTGTINVSGGAISSDTLTFDLINTTATNINFAGAANIINIGADTGTTTINNDLTVSDDLTVNGGSILTTVETFNLLNDTVTTVNFANAATIISIGASTGDTNVNNNLKVTNDLTVASNTILGDDVLEDTISLNATFVSNLLPQVTNSYDLGSTELLWKSIYVKTSADIANIKISNNTIESTNENGDITLNPTGTGKVVVDSNLDVTGNIGLTGDITIGGNIIIGDQPLDTVTVNADFTSSLIPDAGGIYDLGSSEQPWSNLYADSIRLDRAFFSGSPLGTAPITPNILYVTTEGSDTNDGAAIDETRACRTIGGALKSPLYGPGTSIKVSPGRYLEDNPLILKPYTSIIGSDLRTTSIEPINKTQDLFHVDSSCYIAQMQFLNGRSGIVDPYRDRGAYSIAFRVPEENNGKKLDLYKSPYIQNCTNQSGPWLYDGTMFVPNQTVQIPSAVGTTTFEEGVSLITVTVTEGIIVTGMSINTAPQDQGFFSARTLLLANKTFVQQQVIAYITSEINQAVIGSIWYQFEYQREKCFRDVGIIIENVLYDSTFGGNSKSIESGLAYFDGAISVISGEIYQTLSALDFIKTLVTDIIQNETATDYLANLGNVTAGSNIITNIGSTALIVPGRIITGTGIPIGTTVVSVDSPTQITISTLATETQLTPFTTAQQIKNLALTGGNIANIPILNNIDIIKGIIQNGPSSSPTVYYSTGVEFGLVSAEVLMQANRTFLQKEISAYINFAYPAFIYNVAKCERDVGLIVDALSQDLLIGGNSKSIESAVTYYIGTSLVIEGEKNETLDALDRLNILLTQILLNDPENLIVPINSNGLTQTTNTYFQRSFIATESISRNINTIKQIIDVGPIAAPIKYSGSGLFSATGVSADDVKVSTKVESVTFIGGNDYNVVLSSPTVGIGNNSTLYFGYTDVYPKIETEIPERWNNRKVDPWGSVGGMLVDGGVISEISPITSMVMDAYTQVNQGGRGIRVTNKGYAQLVSVFTIFCSIAVQVDNGGICSITNSNSNFGDYCLVSKGYSKREFYGTIYNPAIPPLYPNGRYPINGTIAVYVPDIQYRPHIALVMEVEPPKNYVNAQNKPGFLSSTINLSTIEEGSLVITGIDVTSISIGQTVYIRDQLGRYEDPITGKPYVLPGTLVDDLGYQTIYLSKPINVTASDPSNTGNNVNEVYFTLFTAGNAYYTILSSTPLDPPKPLRSLIIPGGQQGPEVSAVNYLRTLMLSVVANNTIPTNILSQTLVGREEIVSQVTITSYTQGVQSQTRINALIDIVLDIVENNGSDTLLDSTRDQLLASIIKTDPLQVNQGSGDASKLLLANVEFFIAEVVAYLELTYGVEFLYDTAKCTRDVEYITRNVSDDLLAGGNYNVILAGLSYFSREGTHHLVQLEENLTDTSLIPDGSFVNFYQRSYMSASGYLFEYVGSGSNYGALPQVGRVDPDQTREVIQLDSGKVFFTSTDQNGDFRIGTGLVISQATGTLAGRTFQKSLFAEMTPFILALE